MYFVLATMISRRKNSPRHSGYERSFVLERTARPPEGIALAASSLKPMGRTRDAAETAVKLDLRRAHRTFASCCAGMLRDKNYKAAQEHQEFLTAEKPYEIDFWKTHSPCVTLSA